MNQRDDDNLKNDLKGESAISELYQRGRQEGPSAALDQKILARAQQAVDKDLTPPLRRQRPAWLVPLSVAATVVLGVNLAVNLHDFRQDTVYEQGNGVMYSDSDSARTPTGQSTQPAARTPLANRSAASAPVESKQASRTDSWRRTVEEPQTQDTGRKLLISPTEQSSERPPRGQAATPDATGRLELRGYTPGTVPAAPDDLQRGGDFAPPPPMEADRQLAHESAMRFEKEVTQLQRQEQRIVIPAPDPGTRQANSAETENENDVASGRTRPRSLQPASQTTASADSSALERRSVAGSTNSAADTDVDGGRNPGAAKTAELADETGGSLSADDASPVTTPPPVYVCDLQSLRITGEAINRTRREALGAVPPLTTRSWIREIQRLAHREAYTDACRYLAAYVATYGRTDALDNLSVRIPE